MKVQLSFNKILILKDISRYLPFLFRLKTQCACIIFVWKYICFFLLRCIWTGAFWTNICQAPFKVNMQETAW